MVKKEPNQKHKSDIIEMEKGRLKAISGKFADSDNDKPDFSEELSDGGVRNEMAEAQLKKITSGTREV